MVSDRLLSIAHRGASFVAPENTLPAFQAALDLNADPGQNASVDLVELDYRESADGVHVVFHDELLDRTTDACRRWNQSKTRLVAKSLAELRTLDAGSWLADRFTGTRIPTLTEALALIATQSIALVERKAGSARGRLHRATKAERRVVDRVVVQAFDWNFLAECRRQAPELTMAALGEHALTTSDLDEICRLDVPVVAWDHQQVTSELVALVHSRGMKCWTWTVDNPQRMRELTAWGVDGIITNRPDLLE